MYCNRNDSLDDMRFLIPQEACSEREQPVTLGFLFWRSLILSVFVFVTKWNGKGHENESSVNSLYCTSQSASYIICQHHMKKYNTFNFIELKAAAVCSVKFIPWPVTELECVLAGWIQGAVLFRYVENNLQSSEDYIWKKYRFFYICSNLYIRWIREKDVKEGNDGGFFFSCSGDSEERQMGMRNGPCAQLIDRVLFPGGNELAFY